MNQKNQTKNVDRSLRLLGALGNHRLAVSEMYLPSDFIVFRYWEPLIASFFTPSRTVVFNSIFTSHPNLVLLI